MKFRIEMKDKKLNEITNVTETDSMRRNQIFLIVLSIGAIKGRTSLTWNKKK